MVCLEQLPLVVTLPGDREQLFAGLHGGAIVTPREAEVPETPEDGKPARGVVEALHYLQRGEIGRLDERRRRAVYGDERRAQGYPQVEGLRQCLPRLGQLGEERQCAFEEIDGFPVRRASDRLRARLAQVTDSLGGCPRANSVMRQH